MKKVAIGFYGSQKDAPGRYPKLHDRWRPTVGMVCHDDLLIDRLELLVDSKFRWGAEKIGALVEQLSPETEVRYHTVDMEDPWAYDEVFSVLLDFIDGYDFDPDEEEYLVHITTGTHVVQICLFLLTEAGYLPGRLLQTSPPKKGGSTIGTYRLIDLDLSKYDLFAGRYQVRRDEGLTYLKSGIETRNPEFNALIEEMETVAIHSKAPILITGPTGAGKSHIARKIYDLKQQRDQVSGRFVEINCATLRGDAAMSVLFGHLRGAFTGAVTERAGLLREADQGLLFLDEVGELGLDEQAMLLRALEDKRFMPVGADREVSSDFQLIAGTNRDLWHGVGQGKFREDLLARLNLWRFHLPGLAQRREDIEPNLHYELELFEKKHGRRIGFNKEAWQRYLNFAQSPNALWRANFRDLNASITRMGTLAGGGRISLPLVEKEIERLLEQWRRGGERDDGLGDWLSDEQLAGIDPFDRVQLAEVVKVCRMSKTMAQAGRNLFAASRVRKKSSNDSDRLRKYLQKFDMDPAELLK